MTSETDNSLNSWMLLNESHKLGASVLQRNDGSSVAASSIPHSSIFRRTRWRRSGSAGARDGLSDFCIRNEIVRLDASDEDARAAAAALVADEIRLANMCDALERRDRASLSNQILQLSEEFGVPDVLCASSVDLLLELEQVSDDDDLLAYFEREAPPLRENYNMLDEQTRILCLQIDADV
jgi:hypothetical protein